MSHPGLRVLVVDDEPLARSRLRTLLADCRDPGVSDVVEVAQASLVMDSLMRSPVDVVLLDIHMPRLDGLTLAQQVRALPLPPAVIFVTAHAEHAVQAFDLAAVDYLTKPVRLERLQIALQKAERYMASNKPEQADSLQNSLLIQDRGRTERVPLAEVLYVRAELKYLTVRTVQKTYLLDGALSDLEDRHAAQFLRVHRNALVSRHAMQALARQYGHEPSDEGESWVLRLHGVDDALHVSRRHVAAVRAVLSGNARLSS